MMSTLFLCPLSSDNCSCSCSSRSSLSASADTFIAPWSSVVTEILFDRKGLAGKNILGALCIPYVIKTRATAPMPRCAASSRSNSSSASASCCFSVAFVLRLCLLLLLLFGPFLVGSSSDDEPYSCALAACSARLQARRVPAAARVRAPHNVISS